MNKLRTQAFFGLRNKLGLVSPRLLSGSVNKGDATNKDSTKKKKTQYDICGREVAPTGPRCKKDGDGKDGKSGDSKKKKKIPTDECGRSLEPTGPKCD